MKHRTKQVRRPWQANKDGIVQYNKNMNMMQKQNMAMAFIMNMATTYRNEICKNNYANATNIKKHDND